MISSPNHPVIPAWFPAEAAGRCSARGARAVAAAARRWPRRRIRLRPRRGRLECCCPCTDTTGYSKIPLTRCWGREGAQRTTFTALNAEGNNQRWWRWEHFAASRQHWKLLWPSQGLCHRHLQYWGWFWETTGLWGTPCCDWLEGQRFFACQGWYKTLCRSCCEALAQAICEVFG